MRRQLFNRRQHGFLNSLLLALLLFGAYVPVGFMPAAGSPFLLELCPAAVPMSLSMPMSGPAHHHHSDTHSHFEHCPFGSAPAAGPVSHLVAFESPGQIAVHAAVLVESPPFDTRLQRTHQPRGPPSLA